MRRREFLALLGGAALVTPFDAWAQQPALLRVGWLSTGPHPFIEAFRRGLRDLGWIEGQNLVIEQRYAEGKTERLPDLAAELVQHKVDIFVTSGSAAALAAKRATTIVPIVSITSDLVATGIVNSLARPGGNVTGLALMGLELSAKWLELLKEMLPKITRVGILVDASEAGDLQFQAMKEAAPRMAISLARLEAPNADGIDQAFERALKEHVDGLIPVSSTVFAARKDQIVALAAKHRLPAVYEHRDFTDAGGLASYGPDLGAVFLHAASYVDRIVKGAKPADLPVEQPTKFELVINLKTAKALGIELPPSLVLRADAVIE